MSGESGVRIRLYRDFTGSSHTSDLKIGTPVAVLLGSCCYRVSVGTGCLGEMESLICNFYLNMAARKLVRADLSLGCTNVTGTLSKQAINQQTHAGGLSVTCTFRRKCDPPPRNESSCAKPTFAVARNLLQGCENVDVKIFVVTA